MVSTAHLARPQQPFLLARLATHRSFAKGSKGGKNQNRQDKKKAQEKAEIYEEFEGQDLDSIKQDFKDSLEVSGPFR